MPINPNIPLSIIPPDFQAAASSPLLAQGAIQNLQQQRSELKNAPIAQQLLQQQVQGLLAGNDRARSLAPLLEKAQALSNESQSLQNFTTKNAVKGRSLAALSQQIKPDLDAGNISSARKKIQNRIKNLDESGIDSSDSIELLEMIDAGEIDKARNAIDKTLSLFEPKEEVKTVKPGEKLVTTSGREVFSSPLQEDKGKGIETQIKLRKDFTAGAKPFTAANESFSRVKAVFDANDKKAVNDFAKRVKINNPKFAKNVKAFGDLALIFNFMKILDPGSTVREGEFANAQNTAGVDDRVRNLYGQVMAGSRLNDEQRQAIRHQSESQFNTVKENHKNFIRDQINFAKQNNVDTKFIPRSDLELLAEQEVPLTPEEEAELKQLQEEFGNGDR